MQTYVDDCYLSSHTRATDLAAFENNFACLKSTFSGASAPADPVAGMIWYDTSNNILKIRNLANNVWISIYDLANDMVPANKVLLTSLVNGILSADATGRAKMADLFVTNAKINDVSGTKITDNTVTASKFQNNSITPVKMVPGFSSLISSPEKATYSTATGSPAGSWFNCSSTYYVYIPSGTVYVNHFFRSNGTHSTQYAKLIIGGITGPSVSTYTGSTSQESNFSSGVLDIGSLAGTYVNVYMQWYFTSADSTCYLNSWNIQYWGT